MDILVYIIISSIVFSLGFIFGVIYHNRFKHYAGTIFVNYDEVSERLIYSMELESDPNDLQYEDEVTFKVDTSGKSLDRE